MFGSDEWGTTSSSSSDSDAPVLFGSVSPKKKRKRKRRLQRRHRKSPALILVESDDSSSTSSSSSSSSDSDSTAAGRLRRDIGRVLIVSDNSSSAGFRVRSSPLAQPLTSRSHSRSDSPMPFRSGGVRRNALVPATHSGGVRRNALSSLSSTMATLAIPSPVPSSPASASAMDISSALWNAIDSDSDSDSDNNSECKKCLKKKRKKKKKEKAAKLKAAKRRKLSSVKPLKYGPTLERSQTALREQMLANDALADTCLLTYSRKRRAKVELRCNRWLLAATSEVWLAMLFGRFKESSSFARIELHALCFEGLMPCVRFCYGLDPRIDANNVLDALKVADMYCIEALVHACDEFLAKHIDAVIASDAFLELKPAEIRSLLRRPQLKICEEWLWQRLCEWATHNACDRRPPEERCAAIGDCLGIDEVTDADFGDCDEKKLEEEKESGNGGVAVGDSETEWPSAKKSKRKATGDAFDGQSLDDSLRSAASEPSPTADMQLNDSLLLSAPSAEDSDSHALLPKAKKCSSKKKRTETESSGSQLMADGSGELLLAATGTGAVAISDRSMSAMSYVQLLESVIAEVRFPLMSPQFFTDFVVNQRVLSAAQQLSVFCHFHSGRKCAGQCQFQSAPRSADFVLRSAPLATRCVAVRRGLPAADTQWQYHGDLDAIALKASADVFLYGVGLLTNNSTVSLNVYKGSNAPLSVGSTSEDAVIHKSKEQHFGGGKKLEVTAMVLQKLVHLQKDTVYTLELKQTNADGKSSFGVDVRRTKDEANGITFHFSDAAHSPNGTEKNNGAFPTLYFVPIST